MSIVKKSWSKLGKTTVLGTYSEVMDYIDFLMYDANCPVAFDSETDNLNKIENTLAVMQFATDTKEGVIFYNDHKFGKFDPDHLIKIRKKFRKLFRLKNSVKYWVMHNGTFDLAQLMVQLGIDYVYAPIIDTMVFAFLLNENRLHSDVDGPYTLKTLAKEKFNFTSYDEDVLVKRSEGNILDLTYKQLSDYSAMDAYVTMRLLKVLIAYADKQKYRKKVIKLLKHLISPCIKMFTRMSLNGAYVDKDLLKLLLRSDSPIRHRVDEINREYKKDKRLIKVNEELFRSESPGGVKPMFNTGTPWMLDLSKKKHKEMIFYTSKHGFRYKDKKNKKGNYEMGKKFQQKYKNTNKIVAMFEEQQQLNKLKNSYIDAIFKQFNVRDEELSDNKDGRVRANFHMIRTVTGRTASCISKGTFIEVVRDVKRYPKGIKIENIKKGDLVYCFNKNCKPTLREVEWSGKTGYREVIRVHWQSAGNSGYLDVTPEHKIRLVNGKYKEAHKLIKGDRTLAMHRHTCLDKVTFTGQDTRHDHRFIWEKTNNKKLSKEDKIHHIDENHYNNIPSNLEKTNLSLHAKLHNNKEKHPNWRNISRYSIIRLLFLCGGKPVIAKNKYKGDYSCLMNKIKRYKINWKDISFRFGKDGKYISKQRLKKYVGINIETATKELKIGSRRLKELSSFYSLPYGILSKKTYQPKLGMQKRKGNSVLNNHVITKIEILNKKVDVYDIEVKGIHNFIANEICVHNSNPNLQQVPRADNPVKKLIKSLYCASPGKISVQVDFASNEYRLWAALSEDSYLCDLLNDSYEAGEKFRRNPSKKLEKRYKDMADFHKITASIMYNKNISDVTKDLRQISKGINFGLLYGMGIKTLAVQLGKSVDETQELKNKVFNKFKDGSKWIENTQRIVQLQGYVETPIFRRRRLHNLLKSGDEEKVARAIRFAVNSPVQAIASDVSLISCFLLDEYIRKNKKDWLLVNSVHDSCMAEIYPDDLMEYARVVRQIFCIDVVNYIDKKFGWRMPCPVDIDFEVSQGKAWKCKKCNNQYIYSEKRCPKCESLKKEKIKLNNGWGTLVDFNETKQDYERVSMGF